MKSREQVCAEMMASYTRGWRPFYTGEQFRKEYFRWRQEWLDVLWREFPEELRKKGYLNVNHVLAHISTSGIRNSANRVQPARPD